jgi:hypothetical protein
MRGTKVLVTAKPEERVQEQHSDRCGLYSRYPMQGVVLEMANGDHLGVLYGSICSAIIFIPTRGILFQYVDAGDIVKEVEITGADNPESLEQLRQIHLHLTQGKRETLHTKASKIVSAISVNPVAKEEEGTEPEGPAPE